MDSSDILTRDLLAKIAEGNEEAFSELFYAVLPRLHKLLLRITHSQAAAEDLAQETLLKVWVARDKLEELQDPLSWILKIGFYLAVNYLKRTDIRDRAVVAWSSQAGMVTNESVDFRQMQEVISKSVASLPVKQRRIYLSSREQGKTLGEIAADMGLALSTVKNLMVMALRHIREDLEKNGYGPFLLLALVDGFYG